MFSALLSFLGGSAFRLIWEQISGWLNTRQAHAHELEMMRLQANLEALKHKQNLESLKLQADLGVKLVQAQMEGQAYAAEIQAWGKAVSENTNVKSGIWLVDLWNGIIRPAAASIALFLWVVALNAQGWKMGDWDRELVGVILGFWFASRILIPGRK